MVTTQYAVTMLAVLDDASLCRHLDCAQEYENQPEIGKVLKKRFDAGNAKGSTAGISREDVWITSKCFNDRHGEGKVCLLCQCTKSWHASSHSTGCVPHRRLAWQPQVTIPC